MTGCAERASRAVKDFDSEEAERLLLIAIPGSRCCLRGRTAGAARSWPALAATRYG